MSPNGAEILPVYISQQLETTNLREPLGLSTTEELNRSLTDSFAEAAL